MRRMIAFPCAGETLVGTLDEAAGATGLLIVSGGNEIRAGAHRGMARLAARLAAAGTPVFRYDRRGVGDSSGENSGFEGAADDLAAAVRTFRDAVPALSRIVGFGNCDGATTLALYGPAAGVDALVLANPWTIETAGDDALPPPAAIRARYAERLRDPANWWRLLRGGVDLRKLAGGLLKLVPTRSRQAPRLAGRLADALRPLAAAPTVVLATRDATALAFVDHWRRQAFAGVRERATLIEVPTAAHGFSREEDAAALQAAILDAVARYSAASASSSNSAA